MKFLKTIRFDASDEHVFEVTAAPDEWAVSGAFMFAGSDPDQVAGKAKQAFANGFLGLSSFGRSTFTTVSLIEKDELEVVCLGLAAHFVAHYGAPGIEAALPVARDEAGFIVELCADALTNTIFTVRRHFDEGGEIKEEFRTIQAPTKEPRHARIWNVVEDDG